MSRVDPSNINWGCLTILIFMLLVCVVVGVAVYQWVAT